MPQISRRRMLSVSGAAVGGGLASAALIRGTADRTTAASADLDVEGHEVTLRNEEIEAVWLDAAVGWAYEVPSGEKPATVEVSLLAGDDLEVVETASSDEAFLEADGEEEFSVDLLEADVLDVDELRPEDGGETTETTVPVGVEFELLDESDGVIASDDAEVEAAIAVTQDDYDPSEYGDVSGSGELTVETA